MHPLFTTIELLEQILQELPPQDLLPSALLVNKTFHATIIRSPQLQQALFFHPLPGKPAYFAEDRRCSAHAHPNAYVYDSDEERNVLRPPCAGWLQDPDDEEEQVVFRNPFWRVLEAERPMSYFSGERFTRPEASWRRMLVAQPPIIVEPPWVEIVHAAEEGLPGLISVSLSGMGRYDLPTAQNLITGLTYGDLERAIPAEMRGDGRYLRDISSSWIYPRRTRSLRMARDLRRTKEARSCEFLRIQEGPWPLYDEEAEGFRSNGEDGTGVGDESELESTAEQNGKGPRSGVPAWWER